MSCGGRTVYNTEIRTRTGRAARRVATLKVVRYDTGAITILRVVEAL
jgi:hypothetical protein